MSDVSLPTQIGPYRNRIIGLRVMPVGELLDNPHNWRKHPEAQEKGLDAVMRRIGVIDVVRYNEPTNRIFDGHLRKQLFSADPTTPVIVLVTDLTEDEETVALTTFDPLTTLAEADTEKLAALLEAVRETPAAAEDDQVWALLDQIELDHPPALDPATYTFDAPAHSSAPDSPYGNFNLAVTPDQKRLILAWLQHVVGVHPAAPSEEKSAALVEHIKKTWEGWTDVV